MAPAAPSCTSCADSNTIRGPPPYPLSADRFRHDPWSPDVTHAVRTPRCHRQLKWRLNVVSVHNRHLRRKETFALRGRDSPAVPIGSSHGIVVTGQTLVRPPGPTNSLGPRHFGGARICARGAKAGLHAKPLQHPGRAGVTRNRLHPNIVAAHRPGWSPPLTVPSTLRVPSSGQT